MPRPTENQLPRKRAMTPFQLTKPIGIFYEHQQWFLPLFDKLNERSIPYVPIDARTHSYDPCTSEDRYSLFFNRMSASAYLRGHGNAIFYTLSYLAHLERLGVPVVNGHRSFMIETSKSLQLSPFLRYWVSDIRAPSSVTVRKKYPRPHMICVSRSCLNPISEAAEPVSFVSIRRRHWRAPQRRDCSISELIRPPSYRSTSRCEAATSCEPKSWAASFFTQSRFTRRATISNCVTRRIDRK